MSFFGEAARRLGAKACGGFNIVNFNGEHVYVEGAGQLVCLTDERIELRSGRVTVRVSGSGLTVAELEKDSVMISGRIDSETVVRE